MNDLAKFLLTLLACLAVGFFAGYTIWHKEPCPDTTTHITKHDTLLIYLPDTSAQRKDEYDSLVSIVIYEKENNKKLSKKNYDLQAQMDSVKSYPAIQRRTMLLSKLDSIRQLILYPRAGNN